MKKLLFTLIFMMSFFLIDAQTEDNVKMVQLGSLVEVTIYYDSGQIMQHGFMTNDDELHASWESYYEDGRKKCVAHYDKGYKVGIWYYYFTDKTQRVTYDRNKIVKVEDLDPEN